MRNIKKFLATFFVLFPFAANADYIVTYGYGLLPAGSPDRESDTVVSTNGVTSVDVTESKADSASSSTATIRADLADASIRLLTIADNSATSASGLLSDVITFDLNGDDPFELTYSIVVNGNAPCAISTACFAQASLQSRFTGSNDVGINQGATNALAVWGTTYTSMFTIFDGGSYTFSMFYNLAMSGTGTADSLNSALFSWNLPDTYFFSSESGVFLTGVGDNHQSVPEPGTLALLGIGLAGMGLARRRKV